MCGKIKLTIPNKIPKFPIKNLSRKLYELLKTKTLKKQQHKNYNLDYSRNINDFENLGVKNWLISTLRSFGIIRPTEVQKFCIPTLLHGKNVIASSQTGSGKTIAYIIPIIQILRADPSSIFALILAPTRELVFQICEQFKIFSSGVTITVNMLIGGLQMQSQICQLMNRPQIVVATMGRLLHVLKRIEIKNIIGNVRFLVLDEADRLLDSSIEKYFPIVLQHLRNLTVHRQTVLFCASIAQTVEEIKCTTLKESFVFQSYEVIRRVPYLREQYMLVSSRIKEVYLVCLLKKLEYDRIRSCIIFVGTCRICEDLNLLLRKLGVRAISLNSYKSQVARLQALNEFKSSQVSVLIVTDLASRGLDIPKVDIVINFDLPKLVNDYIHRVGRTARAMGNGFSLSFVDPYDIKMLHQLEITIGKQLELYDLPETEVLGTIAWVYSVKKEIKFTSI
jgi:ATP-dependent RNA helicase DDX49/DBP8